MEQLNKAPLSILIIARYDPTFDWVQLTLQEQHYNIVGRVDTVEQALRKISRSHVDIVLADTSGDGVLDVTWIRKLSIQLPDALTLVISTTSEMDFVREAMLAGAQGFLLKPFDLAELSRSIEQVHQLWLQRHAVLAETTEKTRPTGTAHIIAVFSPKGGTGVTTLAVNLAIALKQQTDVPVLLVDADLNTADADVFLNVFSDHTILDLIQLEQKVDTALLEQVAAEHISGIKVIRGDANLQFIDAPVEPGQMGELIEGLVASWDGYIVINTGNNMDRWTVEILDAADTVLLVTTPELPALRTMRNFLELAEARIDQSDKWQLVMNGYQSQKAMRMSDIEESIHYPIKITIAHEVDLVSTSINRGSPVLLTYSKSNVARDIMALAKSLVAANPHLQGSPLTKDTSASPVKGEKSRRFSFRNIFMSALRSSNNLERSVS
jgi:pilus assembly protein CpaE